MVAHRGGTVDAPEHTEAAYRRALDLGVDGVECDVRLTRDGVPVCVHDRRVDATSTGRGVVSVLELSDLAELDFTARSGRRSGDDEVGIDVSERGVLTLDRLLDVLEAAGRPVDVAIETKHPNRYSGQIERAVVDLLRRRGLVSGAAVRPRLMSFSATAVRRVRGLEPDLTTVLLMDRMWLPRQDGSLPPWADVAGISIRALRGDPSYVARAHDRGTPVHVWTVNDDADVELCLRTGVDAVISDRPARVLELAGRLLS